MVLKAKPITKAAIENPATAAAAISAFTILLFCSENSKCDGSSARGYY